MPNLPIDHQEAYTPDEDDPDYRFSEAHGYADWEPPKRPWLKTVTVVVSLLVLLSMALPVLMMFGAAR